MDTSLFKINFYSSQEKSDYKLYMRHVDTGWIVAHEIGDIVSDKKGHPGIAQTFISEGVKTVNPNYMAKIMEHLWRRYNKGEHWSSIQEKLDDIGKWITASEEHAPEFFRPVTI